MANKALKSIKFPGLNDTYTIPQVDNTLAVSGAAADAKKTGDAIGDLKSAIDAYFSPTNLAENATYTGYYYVDYRNGENKSGNSYRATGYIDISGCENIVYSRLYTSNSTSYAGIAFYDENQTFIEGSGISAVFGQSANQFKLQTIAVPVGAKYVRCTGMRTGALASVKIEVYNEAEYNAKIPQKVDINTKDIATLKSNNESFQKYSFESMGRDGYLHLDVAKWVRGDWYDYNTPHSRSFRVRYTEPLTFDRPVILLAKYGFKVCAYYSTGGGLKDGTRLTIPANTTFKLYSRRKYNEDETEVADIELFSQAIKISTALAPIELYKPTFTDVSMFDRVGVVGDSYAASGGIISGITKLSWGKNLERQAGIPVDIYAKSGESVMQWVVDQSKGLPALLAGAECGLYWLHHGLNGTSSAAEIGTPADMSTYPHPNTFYGKYVEAIEAIQAQFPKARIIIATIEGTSVAVAFENHEDANDAIRAIAEYCSIPCVDILDDDFFWSSFYSVYIRSNHLTAMGNAGMAMAVRRLISKCIQSNPEYFIRYGAD